MALHLRIEGIVQGVGYRQWFRRRAEALGLSGWVRNRSDDSVEAVIDGAAEAVEALVREAMNGPAGAKVDAIARRAATADEAAGNTPGSLVILPTV
ncbi:acylphosphatase [Phreatobacter sp.]|uniref:acylphosphatase n=1 Tax=Phreatobacter sp. TaxID=1966341 RepID=UPI0025EC79F0|nr:acylphosphatase [Phreatobacter sp.]